MSDVATEPVDLDLDAERPASFRMQGQVFRLRQLSYRAFAAADKALTDTQNRLDDEAEADEAELDVRLKEAEAAEEEIDPALLEAANQRRSDRWTAQLDAFADFVAANIAEEDLPAFQAMRERDEHGIQQRDTTTLRRWLWEAQIGRPLASAEGSSPGPSSNDPSSRDESGSAAVVRPS